MFKGAVTACWVIVVKLPSSRARLGNSKKTCTCETAGNNLWIIKRTDFQTYILLLDRLVTPSILRPYCWLLKHFKENKETTNHAIIKMLHRVAVDLKTPAMLFQLSLFCTFQKILCDPAANQYKVRLPYVCQSNTPKHSFSTLVVVDFFVDHWWGQSLRSFINVFSRRAKEFNLRFFIRKTFNK